MEVIRRFRRIQVHFSEHGRVSVHVASQGVLDDRSDVFVHLVVQDHEQSLQSKDGHAGSCGLDDFVSLNV